MREPERISRILDKLKRLWEHFPDQRLGQLIDNYVIPSGKPAFQTMPLRNQEDTETEEILDVMLTDRGGIGTCAFYCTGCGKPGGDCHCRPLKGHNISVCIVCGREIEFRFAEEEEESNVPR